ncbi:MAG: YqaA family protein [Candidatus Heimdallarchaeota archaeon]
MNNDNIVAENLHEENTPVDDEIIDQNIQLEKLPFKVRMKNGFLSFFKDKQKVASLVFLLVFITLMIVLGVLEQDPTHIMLDIVYWFERKTGNLGLYLGVAVISTFGNSLMFIPSLYAVVILFVSVLDVNILILGTAAGVGAALGQIVSWFVGRATGVIVSDKLEKQFRKAQKWVERGIAPVMILVFAATPLPDEVLLLTIGMIGYSLWKTLLFCFIGKIILTLSLSFIGNILSTTAFGGWFLKTLFNITLNDLNTRQLPTESNVWASIAIWIFTASGIVLLTFFDWVEIYDKIRCRIEKQVLTDMILIASTASGFSGEKASMDALLTIDDNPVSVNLVNQEQLDIAPEEMLWVLEEQVTKKREAFVRKGVLAVEAITSKDMIFKIDQNWLAEFRANIMENKFSSITTKEMAILKTPEYVSEKGFQSEYAKYITFTTKIRNIIPAKGKMLIEQQDDLTKKAKRRLRRRKIYIEMIIESPPVGSAIIWAVGIKEGTYLYQMEELSREISLIFFLQLLVNFSKYPKTIHDFVIYTMKLKSPTDDEPFEIPEDLLSSCPI